MSNFNSMNPSGFNQNTPSWQQPNYAPSYSMQAPMFNTNIIFVTSPDEALIKTNMRNCDMIYFNQDKNEFYRVKVDAEGRKSWAVFPYTLPEQNETAPATKADIQMLLSRIEALENLKEMKAPATKKKVKEVTDNGELDG